MTWTTIKKLAGLLIFLSFHTAAMGVELNQAIIDRVIEQNDLDTSRCTVDVQHSRLQTRIVDPADLTVTPVTDRPAKGNYPVKVRIESNGSLVERGQVRLNIRIFERVLVALNRINRHRELQVSDFEIKREEITSLREQPVRSHEAIMGMRAKTSLRLGEVLTSNVLQPVPDIEVGGEVTIIFADAWGEITAPGKALQDGSVGETVRVKNRVSGRIVTGQVRDHKSVSVGP